MNHVLKYIYLKYESIKRGDIKKSKNISAEKKVYEKYCV